MCRVPSSCGHRWRRESVSEVEATVHPPSGMLRLLFVQPGMILRVCRLRLDKHRGAEHDIHGRKTALGQDVEAHLNSRERNLHEQTELAQAVVESRSSRERNLHEQRGRERNLQDQRMPKACGGD